MKTLNYKTELPNNVKKVFGKNIFSLQFDKLITEIIKESLMYADKTMKKMAAAKVNESYILTEEAVRISKDLSQEASESIVRILQDDAIYYEHPKALSKRIVDLWGGEKYRAERFARTFTADVATATTVARYRQYGVRYMEFDAELDDRTTNQCRCLNGVQFDLEKDSVDRYRPPLHQHCLTAGSKVQTFHTEKNIEDIQIGDMVLTHTGQYRPVTATMSRIPEEIIEISTDKRTIRITPNHPILSMSTTEGKYWRMAGDFSVGDILVSLEGYEAIQRILSVPVEPVYNISVSQDESYVANGIIVHNCRSGLVPLTDDEYKPDMEFENRNFDNVLDNPDDVTRAFKNIDTFNDKYRVSKFTLDQDLAARIMFEKGFSVGISGPDLEGMVTKLTTKVDDVVKPTLYRESKTIKEAETWVKENTKVKYVDFKGIDVRTANAMNESLARHLELHPELVDKIKYFGTAQGQANLAYQLDLEESVQKFISIGYDRAKAEEFAKAVVKKYKSVSSQEIASYWSRADDACGIGINKNVGKSFDALEAQIRRDVASGFRPVGCDSLEATMDHEFGHALDDAFDIKTNPKFTQFINALSAEDKAAAVSGYGATKTDEFIAEAWSEYLNNPDPRPAAKLIGEIIEDSIKGVKQ